MKTLHRESGAWGELVVLLENHATSGELACEHGLSLWITTPSGKVLFDTGHSTAFEENAKKLGVHLDEADAIVISHGHYDHAGGLPAALEGTTAPLYLGRGATIPKRADGDEGMRDIGMDARLVQGMGERLHLVDSRIRILDDVEILPAAPLVSDPPSDNKRLLRETPNGVEADPFEDEISLLIHSPAGMVLVTGCSHRGIVNLYRQAGPVHTIVGGMHLVHESEEDVRRVAAELSDVDELWVGHCTGEEAVRVLEHELPGKVIPIPAGTRRSL